jgi:hypothetical protein
MEVSTMEEAFPKAKKGGLRTIPFIICKQIDQASILNLVVNLNQ